MKMKTLRDFNFKGKRVLVRCDFNIPLSEKGEILDDFRIKKTIPTIEYLIKKEAKIILISHLGKTGENKTLKPVALRLGKLLRKLVKFLGDCIGLRVEKEIEKMKEKDVILLENLRFHKEEEENDENFAKGLAGLGEIFINDAFSASHRAHASIVGIPKFLSSGAGFLLEEEIKTLKNLMENPKKPLIVIIGGKKVEDKVKAIKKLSEIGELVLLNGLMAKEIKEKKISFKYPKKILEPIDSVDEKDIGQKTINLFKEKIKMAKTIFWNGPLGKIEEEKFQKGTREIAKAIIESKAFSIVGGGETVEFLNREKMTEKFGYVSTGGGALLEFLAGEKLPGIEALH